MSNILDYLQWRGDLPLTAAPFCGVDGLILSQLSMLRWENALAPDQTATPRELLEPMKRQPVSVGFTTDNDLKLLTLAAGSERFGTLPLADYVHDLDEAAEMQFAALTLRLPDGTGFVSFRGTDSSLVGWKEDCNMAFSKPAPAQEAARAYLQRVAANFPGGVRVGGHSKGGNLAMYAAATADEATRARVLAVYNNDGPGLSDRMDAQALYERITGRLHSYVPQGSIVGMLLSHPDEYIVVKSRSVGIMQHDPYSWQVLGPDFVRVPALNRDSARFDATFRKWLAGVDEADRAVLIDTVFNVFSATRSRNFGREFWAGLARNPGAVLAAIQGVDPADRKRIARMLGDLGAMAIKGQ